MIIDTVHDVLIGARWLHFAAMFLLFGGSLFWLDAGRGRWSALRDHPGSVGVTTCLLRCAAPVAVASGLAWLLATVATMTDGFAGALDPVFLRVFFFDTPFGPVELVRLALFAGLLAAAFLPGAARRRFAITAMLSAALLVSQAWLGHAAEGGDTLLGWSMIASYGVHAIAAAAWIGGLPILLLALIERHRGQACTSAKEATLALLQRYSVKATVAASAVVLSGIVNTAFRIGTDANSLAITSYGHVLLAKLVFVAVVLALAALTRFVAIPRLRRLCELRGTVAARSAYSVGLELGFGLLVLAAAAVLGITPPPQ